MALAERLLGTDGTKIGVHQFMAAMGELARGEVTRAQVIAAFNLVGPDVTQLDTLIAAAQAMPAADRFKFSLEMHDVLLLGEAGLVYATPATLATRLGL
jgi:hypothetical protein